MNQNNTIFSSTTVTTPGKAQVTIGKYRIAACPRVLEGGRFAAQVSIASGRGSATTDRVMQFTADFPSFEAAARYAMAQGIHWVRSAICPPQPLTH